MVRPQNEEEKKGGVVFLPRVCKEREGSSKVLQRERVYGGVEQVLPEHEKKSGNKLCKKKKKVKVRGKIGYRSILKIVVSWVERNGGDTKYHPQYLLLIEETI
jgi:hypothetical protein